MAIFKIIFTTTLLILVISISTVFSADQPKTASLRVDGLACPFCAYGLEKKLKKVDGVEKLEIKINEGIVILHFKEGAKIDESLIAKKVKEAGFTPGKFEVEGKSKQEKKETNEHKITLNVDGMSCDGCVSRVKVALSKIDCVQDVEVSLSDKKVTFTCTKGKTDPGQFVDAVEELGFKAEVANN